MIPDATKMNSLVCRSNAVMLRPMQQRQTLLRPFNGRSSDNNDGAMGGGGGGKVPRWWKRNNISGGGDGSGGRDGDDNGLSFSMPGLTQNIHILRARPTGAMMAAKVSMAASVLSSPTAYNRSYGLGFINKMDAQLVRNHLCSKSRVEIIDYSHNAYSVVSVEKKLDINEMPMFIHSMDIQTFVALPFKHNLHIGFVHSVIEENYKEILLEIQTLDAVDMDPFAYKSQLMMNGVFLEDDPDPLVDSIRLMEAIETDETVTATATKTATATVDADEDPNDDEIDYGYDNEPDFDYDYDYDFDDDDDVNTELIKTEMRELRAYEAMIDKYRMSECMYPFIDHPNSSFGKNDKRERRLDF